MIPWVNTLLDPVFSVLLLVPPIIAIIFVALITSLGSALAIKYATNQAVMRELKNELKKSQDRIKQHKGNQEKMLELQTNMLKVQNNYMKHSLRGTIITMLPMLIVFSWMSANFAFVPAMEKEPISFVAYVDEDVTGALSLVPDHDGLFVVNDSVQQIENQKATWTLRGAKGTYYVNVTWVDASADYEKPTSVVHEVQIGTKRVSPALETHKAAIERTQFMYQKLAIIPISIFGYQPGWLMTYFILSLGLTFLFRKMFNIA